MAPKQSRPVVASRPPSLSPSPTPAPPRKARRSESQERARRLTLLSTPAPVWPLESPAGHNPAAVPASALVNIIGVSGDSLDSPDVVPQVVQGAARLAPMVELQGLHDSARRVMEDAKSIMDHIEGVMDRRERLATSGTIQTTPDAPSAEHVPTSHSTALKATEASVQSTPSIIARRSARIILGTTSPLQLPTPATEDRSKRARTEEGSDPTSPVDSRGGKRRARG